MLNLRRRTGGTGFRALQDRDGFGMDFSPTRLYSVALMKLGFIGGGQIASALAGGFLAGQLVRPEEVLVTDRFPDYADAFAARFGGTTVKSSAELAASADLIFLCVKPGDVAGVFDDGLQKSLKGKLLVSVVAGLTLDHLRLHAGEQCHLCRSMPNTAAEVRQSATVVCFSANTTDAEKATVRKAFSTVGAVRELPEKYFDAVVGVSGSGPAYACLLIEAMSDGGVAAGLPREVATELAAQAVQGAATLVLESGRHPAILRERISSPGGTTMAALEQLESGAVRYHISAAVQAAANRSRELSAG